MAAPIAQGTMRRYGTYRVMDENSDKIVDMSVVQVTEVTSSNAMELKGARDVLTTLLKRGSMLDVFLKIGI